MITQQISPNPGLVKDTEGWRISLYSLVSQINQTVGIILKQGDDLAAAINRASANTRFIMTPGIYGSSNTLWVTLKPATVIALPGAIIYGSLTIQGGGTELDGLQFESLGKLLINSNGNTIRNAVFGSSCVATPLVTDNGVYNRYESCRSQATVTPGAIGMDITGSSAIVTNSSFTTHPTAVRYNVAGGHQLSANLGTIIGV